MAASAITTEVRPQRLGVHAAHDARGSSQANAALRRLDQVLWAARTPEELVEVTAALEALRSHVAALEAPVLVEVADRKIAKLQLAWSWTGDWF